MFRLGFRDADPGDLRVRVGHGRDHPGVECAVLAGGHLRGHPALVRGLVGQHGRTGNIPDSEYAGHVGALPVVHRDEALLIDPDAGIGGADLVAVGLPAYRHQHPVEGIFRRRPGTGKPHR